MDEKQLDYEFLSILGESHPGLTFEEYRDSCVFLLFYHYLCLLYDEELEESYKLSAMVRLAVRGKLQMASFLHFIEAASPFLHLASKRFQLTDFSFYQNLTAVVQLEKQKSYARFFRKLIKKMDAWEDRELLLRAYPALFEKLMEEFARAKKETHISENLLELYRMFFSRQAPDSRRLFLPSFEYGLLLNTMTTDLSDIEVYGYEDHDGYREILEILCFMKGIPETAAHLHKKEYWDREHFEAECFDSIGVYMPEGVETGMLPADGVPPHPVMDVAASISKGELPFLLSAVSLLNEKGVMAAILPSALLYREGKESQIRKYLVKESNCLDVVMLLPDHVFQSVGQKEVFFLFQKNRSRDAVMFFDCSEMEEFSEEQLRTIEVAWRERKTVPGFCTCVPREDIEKNEYNLNLPRYIVKSVKMLQVDIEEKRRRIEEINRELKEIDERIAMYKKDLEI